MKKYRLYVVALLTALVATLSFLAFDPTGGEGIKYPSFAQNQSQPQDASR